MNWVEGLTMYASDCYPVGLSQADAEVELRDHAKFTRPRAGHSGAVVACKYAQTGKYKIVSLSHQPPAKSPTTRALDIHHGGLP